MITASNKKVLCRPFESTTIKTKVSNNVKQVEQHTQLAKTTVIFGDDVGEYPPGTAIWLRGDAAVVLKGQQFSVQVGAEEVTFVVVPKEMIVASETPAPETPDEPGPYVRQWHTREERDDEDLDRRRFAERNPVDGPPFSPNVMV
jgi:hypothetical protein